MGRTAARKPRARAATMARAMATAKKRIIPSASEARAIESVAAEAMELVGCEIDGRQGIQGAELGGSFAKGTWLAGADVDIFVVFDESVSDSRLASESRRVGFASMADHRPYVRYASHPYVEATIRRTKVNVVPCYGVKSGNWRSAADRSRFHTRFMRDALDGTMRDDVRILKRLLQSNGLYGAELAREAFSGYACEVLVSNHGSLERAVRALAQASRGLVIGEAAGKQETPVAIMDPVDSSRNLALAVSPANIGRLIMLCRALLARPSASIILSGARAAPDSGVLKTTVTVRFGSRPRPPETIWGQAKSAASALASRLSSGGFGVMRHGAHVDARGRVTLAFVLESTSTSRWSVGMGPDHFDAANASGFVTANVGRSPLVWVGADSRLRAIRQREHTTAAALLEDSLTRRLGDSGVPAGLKRDIRAGFAVRTGVRASDRTFLETMHDLVSTDTRSFGRSR